MKETGKKKTRKRVTRNTDAPVRKPMVRDVHFKLDADDAELLRQTIESGGFVSGSNRSGKVRRQTISQFFRYCLRHINDNKEINLTTKKMEKVDALIDAIADNRKPLEEGLSDVRRLIDDFRVVGVNINQVVHQINYLVWIAGMEGIAKNLESLLRNLEDYVPDLMMIINGYYSGELNKNFLGVSEYVDMANNLLDPSVTLLARIMKREDDILERLII